MAKRTRYKGRGIVWSEGELSALREWFPRGKWPDIQSAIPTRSRAGIVNMAAVLNLERVKEITPHEITELEKAWLAGFLEGEGSFTCTLMQKKYPCIQITFNTTDGDVAKRAATFLGAKANGPYEKRIGTKVLGTKPYWSVRKSGEAAARIMKDLLPYMGERRSQQINSSLAKWDRRPGKYRELGARADCHPDRRHYSRGLCRPCHFKFFRYDMHKMSEAEVVAILERPLCPL